MFELKNKFAKAMLVFEDWSRTILSSEDRDLFDFSNPDYLLTLGIKDYETLVFHHYVGMAQRIVVIDSEETWLSFHGRKNVYPKALFACETEIIYQLSDLTPETLRLIFVKKESCPHCDEDTPIGSKDDLHICEHCGEKFAI